MRYAITSDGVVIAVFMNGCDRDWFYKSLEIRYPCLELRKCIVKEVKV